jgi:hypothetical protein
LVFPFAMAHFARTTLRASSRRSSAASASSVHEGRRYGPFLKRLSCCHGFRRLPGHVRRGECASRRTFGVHRLLAACILSPMPSKAEFREARRSTRVPLNVVITVQGGAVSLTCDGETIVVNLHGALLATAIGLNTGMRISIHVYLTDKRAAARVVYIDPKNPRLCGIELDEPRNIWGVSLPPDDWTADLDAAH